MSTLSTPTISQTFPAGTTDTPWSFVMSGTNPDGSAYNNTITNTAPTATSPSDWQPGLVVVLVVMKNGVSSLPSDPFTYAGTPVTLSVPDAGQKATILA